MKERRIRAAIKIAKSARKWLGLPLNPNRKQAGECQAAEPRSPSSARNGRKGPTEGAKPRVAGVAKTQDKRREKDDTQEKRKRDLLKRIARARREACINIGTKNLDEKLREMQGLKKKSFKSSKSFLKKLMSTIRVATVNAEGINEADSFKRRELEEYATENNIDIMLLQETNHPHSGEEGGREKLDWENKKVGGQYKWYFSSGIDPQDVDKWKKARSSNKKSDALFKKAREIAGVAAMVSKRMQTYLVTADPEGSRLMRIRLKMKKRLDILIAYGQQADKTPREKDEFYKDLQAAVKETPVRHALIIAGDLNTKAMRARAEEEMEIIGEHALYDEQNEIGMGKGTKDNRERDSYDSAQRMA